MAWRGEDESSNNGKEKKTTFKRTRKKTHDAGTWHGEVMSNRQTMGKTERKQRSRERDKKER